MAIVKNRGGNQILGEADLRKGSQTLGLSLTDMGETQKTLHRVVASADMTTAADISIEPDKDAHLVVTDVIVSTDTAMDFTLKEATSGTTIGGAYYLPANSTVQLTPRGSGWRLPRKGTRLQGEASVAGNLTVETWAKSVREYDINALNPLVWLDAQLGINVADNTDIPSWTGQSENGKIFAQTTTLDQPLYQLNDINNAHVVEFDGAEYLEAPETFASTYQGDTTTIIVLQPDDGQVVAGERPFGLQEGATDRLLFHIMPDGKLEIEYRANGNLAEAITENVIYADGAQSQMSIFTGLLHSTRKDVDGIEIYFNGAKQALSATQDGDTSGVVFGDYNPTIVPFLGAQNVDGSESTHFIGRMGDFLIFDRILTEWELNIVHDTLKLKYGILNA